MFSKSFALAVLVLAPCVVLAESNPVSSDRYKWHDAALNDGDTAVVKQDYWFTDVTKPNVSIRDRDTARMFAEKVILNGRKAVRLFEVHSLPICPPEPTVCTVVFGYARHIRNSMDYETREVFHGVAKAGPNGREAFITNDYIVNLIWTEKVFTINTSQFANYNSGLAALFSERAGEFTTTTNPSSDAGFSRMNSAAFNGTSRGTTDGLWANIKRTISVQDERDSQPTTSSPRVINQ